jgi:urease accessory protein
MRVETAPVGEELLPPDRHLLLATWLSPAFPVGGFAYSHGLEQAIAGGQIIGSAALRGWLSDLIASGSGWNDALLLAHAWHAGTSGDAAGLGALAELSAALAPSAERHLEAVSLGAAFIRAVQAGWPAPLLARLEAGITRSPVTYPVAVGAAAAAHRLPVAATLAGYLNAFVATLISVGVRLIPIGQAEGLGILAALQPLALATGARAATETLDALGSATILSDIAAMRHETLYSRLFRS